MCYYLLSFSDEVLNKCLLIQWMYLLPIGLIVMNAITQAMNLPEEQQAGGQTGAQVQQTVSGVPRGQGAAVRRR